MAKVGGRGCTIEKGADIEVYVALLLPIDFENSIDWMPISRSTLSASLLTTYPTIKDSTKGCSKIG